MLCMYAALTVGSCPCCASAACAPCISCTPADAERAVGRRDTSTGFLKTAQGLSTAVAAAEGAPALVLPVARPCGTGQ